MIKSLDKLLSKKQKEAFIFFGGRGCSCESYYKHTCYRCDKLREGAYKEEVSLFNDLGWFLGYDLSDAGHKAMEVLTGEAPYPFSKAAWRAHDAKRKA